VLDALRARKERFIFEEVEIGLKATVMAFITMNPGYPGRAGEWSVCRLICNLLLLLKEYQARVYLFDEDGRLHAYLMLPG